MFKKRSRQQAKLDINLDEIEHEDVEKKTVRDEQKQEQKGKDLNLDVKKNEQTNNIGGTTKKRKLETQIATHEKFESMNYKKGDQGKILVGDEAIETQTQMAKRRYLENAQITKKIKEGKLDGKIYRGTNNYANYRLTQEEIQNPNDHYKWKFGPARAKESSARNTCRFDYDPSRCKDWHDSGYCVFGNSCIYLHDRSNYKTGWQMEKDYERSERQRWRRINNPDLQQEQDPQYLKDLQKFKPPQKCEYCSQPFKSPVQVCCRHIFCLKCAGKMQSKQGKCKICGKKLDGIMNSAEKSLKQKKEQYEEMVKVAASNKQIAAGKRSKYRGLNSLDVFTGNEK